MKRFTVPAVSSALTKAEKVSFFGFPQLDGNSKSYVLSRFRLLTRKSLARICLFNGLPFEGRNKCELLSLLHGDDETSKVVSEVTQAKKSTPSKVIVSVRGRSFSEAELRLMQKVIDRWHESGITVVSNLICDALSWRQSNGWPKSRSCRSALISLQAEGYLRGIKSLTEGRARQYSNVHSAKIDASAESHEIIELIEGSLRLDRAKEKNDVYLWNCLVKKHHYLGHMVAVGRSMKFFVKDDRRILAAMSISDASWSVKARDDLTKPLMISQEEIVNNSRFLVLPYVRVKNLASRCLSLLVTVGSRIWKDYYGTPVAMFETYVDSSRFEGTCYKAANWIYIGDTLGFSKKGGAHVKTGNKKFIFAFPTDKRVRELVSQKIAICRDKPERRRA